jgi:hypothetical protein
MDGPEIESRWGRDLPYWFRPNLGPTQPPVQWVPGPFPGGKVAWCGVDQALTSSAEVKERVELYLYSTSGPSWPVLGRTFAACLTRVECSEKFETAGISVNIYKKNLNSNPEVLLCYFQS